MTKTRRFHDLIHEGKAKSEAMAESGVTKNSANTLSSKKYFEKMCEKYQCNKDEIPEADKES